MQSHDSKGRKFGNRTERVCECVITLLQSYDSKNVGSVRVCL